ncbi:MAG: hypothetical protein K8U03_22550 [Planctomycetia bacterium]|nr:hypothetical protein [Planctomycetia bacterium]
MRRTCFRLAVVLTLSLSLFAPTTTSADEAGAQKYLAQAKQQVADKETADKIDITLRLSEAELTGVDQAKKDPILKEIAALRTGMQTAAADEFKKNLGRELDKRFEQAQGQLGLRQTGINKELDDLEALLKDPKTTAALGPEKTTEYRTKLSTFRAVNTQKMQEETIAVMKRGVESTEAKFPEWLTDLKSDSPNSRDGAAQSFQRRLDEFQGLAKEVPVGSSAVAELATRMNKMKAQVDALYGTAMVVEIADRLKRNWEIGIDEIAGWEAETTPPKFADLVTQSSAANSRLGAPKTVELLSRANQFFANLETNTEAKPYLQTSPLKEFVASIGAQRAAAYQKLGGFADVILAEAAATKLSQRSRDRLESFGQDDLRLSLAGHPQLAAFQARAQQPIAAFDQSMASVAVAHGDALATMTKEAAVNWPTLIKDIKADEKFDPTKAPAFIGKLIRLRSNRNEAGWGYGIEGGFDYITEINGKPVAGKYAPAVRAAVDDMKKKTGLDSLPEETPYDVIARVDSGVATLQRREQREVKFSGDLQGSLSGEAKVPVEAPIVTVVGLYCGPVAVVSPPEELAETSMHTSAGSGGSGFLGRLIAMTLFLLAALAVLVKAEFAPVATVPQLAKVRDNLHARNQTLIGGVLLIVAAYGLFRGYFYHGLLGNLVLGASGVYLALHYFERQTWWKPDYSAKLRGLALPLGFACVGLAVWRLLFVDMIRII